MQFSMAVLKSVSWDSLKMLFVTRISVSPFNVFINSLKGASQLFRLAWQPGHKKIKPSR